MMFGQSAVGSGQSVPQNFKRDARLAVLNRDGRLPTAGHRLPTWSKP